MTDNEYLAMLLNRGIDKYKNRSNKLDMVEEVRKIRQQLVELELVYLEEIGAIIPAEEVQNGMGVTSLRNLLIFKAERSTGYARMEFPN